MKKVLFCIFFTPILAGARPGAAAGPMPGFPQLTPNQYQEMMSEVDNYLSKMSEEEINTMVQEAMKDPGFQKFVEDVETGKIKPEELFGVTPSPGVAQPVPNVPPPQAQTGPAPQPAPVAKPAEKPTITPLRSKSSALEMLKALIASIGNLRMKGASYHKVGDMLRPWNKSLDKFVYYLSALVDTKKADHVEQLIGDRNFLPLHDALKRLSDDLRSLEPRVETPEFGERDMARDVKEQSKVALQKVLGLFQYAFEMQQLIPGLEQLFAKYEPEIVRRRKAVEDAEQRAIKEAEQAKQIRPSNARIEREMRYVRPAPTFYDWYYEQPEAPRYYDRGHEYEPYDLGRTPDLKPSLGGGEPKKSTIPVEKGEIEKKPEAYKPGKAEKPKITAKVEPGLSEIGQASQKIADVLADSFENTFNPNFGALAPTYLVTGEARNIGGSREQRAARDMRIATKAMTFATGISNITEALAVIQKLRGDVSYEISKMPTGVAKDKANKQLAEALTKNREVLQRIYDASVELARKVAADEIGSVGSPLSNWMQLPALYGAEGAQEIFGIEEPEFQGTNVIGKFQEAFELVYGVDKAAREENEKVMRATLRAQMVGAEQVPRARPSRRQGQPPAVSETGYQRAVRQARQNANDLPD